MGFQAAACSIYFCFCILIGYIIPSASEVWRWKLYSLINQCFCYINVVVESGIGWGSFAALSKVESHLCEASFPKYAQLWVRGLSSALRLTEQAARNPSQCHQSRYSKISYIKSDFEECIDPPSVVA